MPKRPKRTRGEIQRQRWADAHDEAVRRVKDEDVPPPVFDMSPEGLPIPRGVGPDVGMCPAKTRAGNPCTKYAGQGTPYPGTGPCRAHGGATKQQLITGAWVMAHSIAGIMDVDPWETLEIAMRRAFSWSAWYQAKLAGVTDDDDLRPGGRAWDWVKGAERTTELAAKYAKMALDAGVAERHVRAVELQGELIAKVLTNTLHELGLPQDDEDRAREIMESQLIALAEQGRATVVGEITSSVTHRVDTDE